MPTQMQILSYALMVLVVIIVGLPRLWMALGSLKTNQEIYSVPTQWLPASPRWDNFADAWYVGYTPRLCTSVWVGYPEGSRSLVGVHGIQEPNGETLPMDIWSNYMEEATAGDLELGFPEADESGLDLLEGNYSSGF